MLSSVLLIVLLIFMRILLIVLIFGCIIGGVYGFLVIWLVYLFYMLVNSLVAFYSIKPCCGRGVGGTPPSLSWEVSDAKNGPKSTFFFEKSLRRNAVNSSVFAVCGLLPWKM